MHTHTHARSGTCTRINKTAIDYKPISLCTGGQVPKYGALISDHPSQKSSKRSVEKKIVTHDNNKKLRQQTLPAMRVAYWGNRHHDDSTRERERDTPDKTPNIDLMASRLMRISRMSPNQVLPSTYGLHPLTTLYRFRLEVF